MQRQSLGSPSSKIAKDEELPSQSPPSSSSAAASSLLYGQECQKEEELKKLNPKTTMPQTYIHFIPLLTLFCFLILFLSSHDPSLNDSSEFNGVDTISDPSENISELQRMLEIEKGDILAIRSLKNLKQEAHAAKHRQLHRKFAHF